MFGTAPAGWTEVPKFVKTTQPDPQCALLVHEILRQGDRAGTDIRLDVGIPFRFKAFPRAGLRTSYFGWRIVHGYKWKHTSHINALELQGVVNSLQWRLRRLANYRKRVLHLVDSQVVASVVAKGRTSSFRLRKSLQKTELPPSDSWDSTLYWILPHLRKPCRHTIAMVRSQENRLQRQHKRRGLNLRESPRNAPSC